MNADPAALPDGHRIFEYRIERTLGGGGFGITYLARDANLDLPVAVKEYFPGDLAFRGAKLRVTTRNAEADGQFQWGLERFLDEARALATFRHPNIVRVLRYFRENGTAYIVMEYESGDPLKRWLGRQTLFGQRELLALVHPLLDGLEAVHAAGFLHRDIKPDNIYVRADGAPVLLDFGAARRVSGNRDLTNVVSPGFAPFEQYHSHGNQGPWTDLYSLGAVMYWMSTGRKPMESAARVKEDAMPSAQSIGDRERFDEALLRAIDWAMSPDERKRPQSVAELRALLGGLDSSRTTSRPQTVSRTVPDRSADASRPLIRPGASGLPDSLRRNVLATVMFLDIVGYAAQPIGQQVALRGHLTETLSRALRGIEPGSRVIMDTSDGIATCFLGDPEEALKSALLLRDLLTQKFRGMLTVRIGLHLGPVRLVPGANDQMNVVGDGLNVAQRVMDFAQPNQVIVSRALRDVMTEIGDGGAAAFRALGPHLDRHMRTHEIYAIVDPHDAAAQPEAPPLDAFARTAPGTATLTRDNVAEIEAELSRLIGPLARVLVKKAVARSLTPESLREQLAVSIPDAAQRDAFIAGRTATTTTHSRSQTRSRDPYASRSQPPQSASMPLSSPSSRPAELSGGHSRSRSASQPPSQPVHSAPSVRRADLSDIQVARLERALSEHIGPMARMILRQEAQRHADLQALIEALARAIDQPNSRKVFLAEAQRIRASRA